VNHSNDPNVTDGEADLAARDRSIVRPT